MSLELHAWLYPIFLYLAGCRILSERRWVNVLVWFVPAGLIFHRQLPQDEPLLDALSVGVFLVLFYGFALTWAWARERFER